MFKKVFLILFLITFVNSASINYGDVLISRIISVYDGDTFRADINSYPDILGNNISIRVNGVDTPEMRGSKPEIKELAIKARDLVKDKLMNGKVIILKNIQRGKYFRIVADVYIDGVDLKEILFEAGLAKPYDGGTKQQW
jgi:endonuclease YncB( thermonuclease family)